jgi:hypothetical protein
VESNAEGMVEVVLNTAMYGEKASTGRETDRVNLRGAIVCSSSK